jgi:hypothetical protein
MLRSLGTSNHRLFEAKLTGNAQTVFLTLICGRSLVRVSSSLAGPECIVLQ